MEVVFGVLLVWAIATVFIRFVGNPDSSVSSTRSRSQWADHPEDSSPDYGCPFEGPEYDAERAQYEHHYESLIDRD